MFFLGKYTSGDAKTCIQGYLTLYTDEAYAQAKAVLISRYGEKVKVARAYKTKLNNWPVIKVHETDNCRNLQISYGNAMLLWPLSAIFTASTVQRKTRE